MRNVKPAVLSTIFNMADRQEETSCQDYKGKNRIQHRFNDGVNIIFKKQSKEIKVHFSIRKSWTLRFDPKADGVQVIIAIFSDVYQK